MRTDESFCFARAAFSTLHRPRNLVAGSPHTMPADHANAATLPEPTCLCHMSFGPICSRLLMYLAYHSPMSDQRCCHYQSPILLHLVRFATSASRQQQGHGFQVACLLFRHRAAIRALCGTALASHISIVNLQNEDFPSQRSRSPNDSSPAWHSVHGVQDVKLVHAAGCDDVEARELAESKMYEAQATLCGKSTLRKAGVLTMS